MSGLAISSDSSAAKTSTHLEERLQLPGSMSSFFKDTFLPYVTLHGGTINANRRISVNPYQREIKVLKDPEASETDQNEAQKMLNQGVQDFEDFQRRATVTLNTLRTGMETQKQIVQKKTQKVSTHLKSLETEVAKLLKSSKSEEHAHWTDSQKGIEKIKTNINRIVESNIETSQNAGTEHKAWKAFRDANITPVLKELKQHTRSTASCPCSWSTLAKRTGVFVVLGLGAAAAWIIPKYVFATGMTK